MINKIALTFFLISFSIMTYGAGIYKWVDEKGIVHYGDTVPDKYKATATAEPELIDTPSAKEEAEAIREREKARAVMEREPLTEEPASDTSSDTAELDDDENSRKAACQEQWKKYNESLECFAPYRNATGGVKAEAYNYCIEVTKPPLCE